VKDGFLWSGWVCLVVATWNAFRSIRRGDRKELLSARICSGIAILSLTAELVAKGIRTAHFPIDGAAEGFLFLAVAITGTALLLDGLMGWSILLVATLPLSCVTVGLAWALTYAPSGPVPENLSSLWLGLHIFTALGAYAAFAMAFISGILYLVSQRQLKVHTTGSIHGWMPPLETVRRLTRRAIVVGVLLQAGGLVVGYLQARKVMGLGADWRQDPKIWLTTVTLAVYVAILVLGERPSLKGRRTALASVAAFALVMLTFWASVFWSGFHRFH
jgi:HemX protein